MNSQTAEDECSGCFSLLSHLEVPERSVMPLTRQIQAPESAVYDFKQVVGANI